MRSISASSEDACGGIARAREGGAAAVVRTARPAPAVSLDFGNMVIPRAVSWGTIVILRPTLGMPTEVRCDGSHKTALPARMGWPFRCAIGCSMRPYGRGGYRLESVWAGVASRGLKGAARERLPRD